jgi:hypothetical protein
VRRQPSCLILNLPTDQLCKTCVFRAWVAAKKTAVLQYDQTQLAGRPVESLGLVYAASPDLEVQAVNMRTQMTSNTPIILRGGSFVWWIICVTDVAHPDCVPSHCYLILQTRDRQSLVVRIVSREH